jgi:hypothetical protein
MESGWRGPIDVMRERIKVSGIPLIVGDTPMYLLRVVCGSSSGRLLTRFTPAPKDLDSEIRHQFSEW